MSAAAWLAPALAHRDLMAGFSSPLRRVMHAAELAGLSNVRPDPDLMEWDYGGYEGMTQGQIQQISPGWNLWRDGVMPGDDATQLGETLHHVARGRSVVVGEGPG